MFNDFGKDIASTLSGVFGDTVHYSRDGVYSDDIAAVIQKDVDVFDENDQIVGRATTIRIAVKDIPIVPERGDTIDDGTTIYTLGRRISDNGYSYLHEATS